jgi:hypothetical protein
MWAPQAVISRFYNPASTYRCQRFTTPSRVVDALGLAPE